DTPQPSVRTSAKVVARDTRAIPRETASAESNEERHMRLAILRLLEFSLESRCNDSESFESTCLRLLRATLISKRAGRRTSVEEVRTTDQPAPNMRRGRLWRRGGGGLRYYDAAAAAHAGAHPHSSHPYPEPFARSRRSLSP
ncbi:hypothetical protein X777_05981, partial [Ooceraea biroi]